MQQTLEPLIAENNSAFAIKVEHYHYMTKDRSQATEVYRIDKEAEEGVRIIKEEIETSVFNSNKEFDLTSYIRVYANGTLINIS